MSRKLIKKVPDELKHLIKSENDLITILQKCEPLSEGQINETLSLASETSFNYVRVYLLEKKEDYI